MKVIYQGNPVEIDEGSVGFNAVKILEPERKKEALAFCVDGAIIDMNQPVPEGKEISFVFPESKEGFEMMNHSCSHLMAQAIHHLYPKAQFGFGPAIEEGFYYDVDFGEDKLTDADFAKIEEEMKKLMS